MTYFLCSLLFLLSITGRYSLRYWYCSLFLILIIWVYFLVGTPFRYILCPFEESSFAISLSSIYPSYYSLDSGVILRGVGEVNASQLSYIPSEGEKYKYKHFLKVFGQTNRQWYLPSSHFVDNMCTFARNLNLENLETIYWAYVHRIWQNQ